MRQSVIKVNFLSEENSDVCVWSVMEAKMKEFFWLIREKLKVGYTIQVSNFKFQILNPLKFEIWNLKFLFLLFLSINALSQKKDTTVILVSSYEVQNETTDAMNYLYNYQFDKFNEQLSIIKPKYRWHPLPYFLEGLAEWWKIVPNMKEKKYDDKFLQCMDSAILIAENLHKHFPEYRIEAAFFLAAAHGFKGELYSDEERKNWVKAASEGKAALNYMDECHEKTHLSTELLFGDALYNYFREWVPENYKSLKAIFWFFRHGDKQLGLKQLKEVAYNAFYTRTEAMIWLMRILANYENDAPRALQISLYLHQTYPDNPYFHRYYARMLYSQGQQAQMEIESKKIMQYIDSGKLGYEATSGRYATFFLGQMYDFKRKYDEAKYYYLMSVKYSMQVDATDSGYFIYTLMALGDIYARQKDNESAKRYYQMTMKYTGHKDVSHKEAKKKLDALGKKK